MFVCLFCLSVNFFLSKISRQQLELGFLKLVQNLTVINCIGVTKTAVYCLSVSLFVHFSFSPIEISVTDFSAPIRASVLKFCVHLSAGKVYCLDGH